MDFVQSIFSTAFGYILPFLFVLTIVVFFHELGHFLVARWCGVTVKAFSVGFGRELFGWTDKKGTRWKLSVIPLGGYVKFAGDENEASAPDQEALRQMSEEELRGAFQTKSVGKRAAVVAAGPIANFILSIVLFALIFAIVGRAEIAPRVDAVQPASAASDAGLQPGDLIVRIDGFPIETFNDLQRIIATSADVPLDVTVVRGDEILTFSVTPRRREIEDPFGNVQKIGVLGVSRSPSPEDIVERTYGPVEALGEGVKETWFVVERTGSYLTGIVVGRESADQLGGPIRVAQISGQVATLGFAALINLTAILSVSIGLLNLFPIPMLDGGHLLFYAVEAIRGKPLSERVQDYGFRIGIAIVLMLMIFATWNDVMHLSSL
ncbi:RIP metalloprotease RseP [Rhizobiales bacterium]|uniref:RIP metalloprotease RseP n=1 Tax=Hongsoonwoonella zoysiae TaxID=2821844 RepID=UPI001560EA4A|nr:RIP metalloprotease RseP [Hongsoonwoonella zoysiae]NRG18701.1 RIP metalloprotease RseP [Hongsoonwoonella zoysiae]